LVTFHPQPNIFLPLSSLLLRLTAHCLTRSFLESSSHPVIAKRFGNHPENCHREEQSDVAISLKVVIARSKAAWQSPSRSSLRGAKRRGNLPQRCYGGLSFPSCHREPPVLYPVAWRSAIRPSLRAAKRRGNLPQGHYGGQSSSSCHREPPVLYPVAWRSAFRSSFALNIHFYLSPFLHSPPPFWLVNGGGGRGSSLYPFLISACKWGRRERVLSLPFPHFSL
jgi:hypothetical protein